ncbi:MAG: hypothetical protein WBE40_02930 [Thermoplasmata archaeon]
MDADPSQLARPAAERAYWPLRLETPNEPSRWVTADALRALARLAGE